MSSIDVLFPDFSQLLDGTGIPVVCNKPTLILAITARTGSTNLCSILGNTGIFCEPAEIFNPRGVIQQLKEQHSAESFTQYLEALVRNPEPHFAFKTSWADFEPVAGIFRNLFPQATFVFLDRFDVAAQAVSLYRAMVSGEWHREQSPDPAGASAEFDTRLDIEQAVGLMADLIHEKFFWERFFFSEQINAQHFYYEIFEKDWAKVTASILSQCGYGGDVARQAVTGKYSKISDALSEQWVRQLKKAAGLEWLNLG